MAKAQDAASDIAVQTVRIGLAFVSYLALAVLLVAAGYEIALAVGAISPGALPGQAPAGSGTVILATLFAMLVGAGTCLIVLALQPLPAALPAIVGLAPAAAAFVAARFYTYDPYYLPTLRRISDNGAVPEVWIYGLLIASLAAAVCAKTRPAYGLPMTSLVLVLCAFTTIFQAAGH